MRKFISEIIADTVRFLCRINSPYSIKEMTQERCIEIIKAAKVGDVILLRTKGELTTLLQGQKWTHSCIVVDNISLLEAVTTNVRNTIIMYALARCDEAILLRPTKYVDTLALQNYARSRLNYPYDFSFDSSDEAYYCHELVAKALKESAKVEVPKVKTPLGEKYLPDSFLKSGLFTQIL